MIEVLKFRIVGKAPLLMHNGQLADPSNWYSRKIKEISSKRKKVDADFEEMARLEFLGGLYLADNQPCIPNYVFEAAIIGKGGAARKERMGKEAAAGFYVTESAELEYDGPRNPDELWEDKRFRSRVPVRVGQARIMRTRPVFKPPWSAVIVAEFDGDLLNGEDVRRWIEVAGPQVGLMDWRPRYGRFEVKWL